MLHGKCISIISLLQFSILADLTKSAWFGHIRIGSVQPNGRLTIGNVGDLTKDVVSADLFVPLWWANQCLADHGNIDFGTNTPVGGLKAEQHS